MVLFLFWVFWIFFSAVLVLVFVFLTGEFNSHRFLKQLEEVFSAFPVKLLLQCLTMENFSK